MEIFELFAVKCQISINEIIVQCLCKVLLIISEKCCQSVVNRL